MAGALSGMRESIESAMRRCMHLYWRLTRGLTLGVRGLVIDDDRRVFLVQHTYVRGWHLPGGGVEPGETLLAALARELAEEGNIELTAPPGLHGMFFNGRISRRDHVACYVIQAFRQSAPPAGYDGPGHSFARFLRWRVGDNGHRAGLNRLVDEAVSVGGLPVHGHEHAPWLHPARVIFHTTDAWIPGLGEDLRALQQMLEGHGWEL